jgi:cytochrome c2
VYLGAFLALIGLWVRDSDLRYRVTGLLALAFLLSGCGPDPKFEAWELVPGGDAKKGKVLILQHGCGSCHTIPGVEGAHGQVGPPLTKVALRTYLAGRIHNTPENMARWIANPKEIDDKTVMPNTGVTPENANHIVRYLYTLR